MDPMTIATAAQAGAGIVQGVVGAFQKGKAKRMARANKRPVYAIQKGITDNQAIAESRAGQGISDASRQFLRQDSERGLTSSIDAILAGGGSVNNIADLYGNYQTGISKMALVDEEMRTKNVQNLIAQNNMMAAEQDKAWQVNIYAPYADKAQAAAALSKQGTDNMWKGINSVIGAGANYASGKMYQNEADRVFGETNRINDAYIGSLGSNENSAGFNPNGNQNPFNWYQPKQQRFQPTVQQNLQQQYPGLMMGNMGYDAGGYDMEMFGG